MTEKQLYLKFLENKNAPNLNPVDLPKEVFTPDRAFILSELEIFSFATENDMKCEILINPGKYLENYSFTSFAYQKDFALKEILDYHLQKLKQGIVKFFTLSILFTFNSFLILNRTHCKITKYLQKTII